MNYIEPRKIKKVVLSGKQGSGKTTTAEALQKWAQENYWPSYLFKFADPLYEMHNAVREIALEYGIDMPKKDGVLLQFLGTDWGRQHFGEDVWVNCMRHRLNKLEERFSKEVNKQVYNPEKTLIIIDDCRFPNEYTSMFDALRVRLVASREIRKQRTDSWRDNEEHPSEVALDDFESRFDLLFETSITPVEVIVKKIVGILTSGIPERRE